MHKLTSSALWLVVMLHVTPVLLGQPAQSLRLWYTAPAGDAWENALPVGNGRLGAMVYGNVPEEVIQLNEHTIWSGGPNSNNNPLARQSVPAIRQLILLGKNKEAEALADKTIISRASQGQMFQPAGELHLVFDGHEAFTQYERELDISKAISTTSYRVGKIRYTRETFASLPHRLIVMHLTASEARSISFTAYYTSPQTGVSVKTESPSQLTFHATTISHEGVTGRVRYKGIVQFRTTGGFATTTDTSVVIRDADEVTLYISIATNFISYKNLSGDETARAAMWLNKGMRHPYNIIRQAHISAYRRLFDRVGLRIGDDDPGASLPTNERLAKFRKGNDPQFAALYFQYGRYLLISSSQPGGQPANLQGIWNNQLKPAWDSKYTININAEMNYWPAEKTNLSGLHEPFLNMVKEMSEAGQQTAGEMYGTRGWMAHHNTDIWRATGAVDGAFWGLWNQGGGWTIQHLWQHYQYTGDKKFLASAYPVMKGAALFYVDFLTEHPATHWLVINPDESPENAPAAHHGSSLDAGTTMSNQIAFDVFSTVMAAARVLHRDGRFSDTLAALRKRLPPMQIGRYGQLQEWLDDIDSPTDNHRHISHLYGLFPSNQISPFRTPALYNAAAVTLRQRGDLSTGWSMGWKVNWWARMLDGNHAYKLIADQLTPLGVNPGGGGTYNNLFDAHPPFQIDGNFGCTSGIAEMLVQSADGSVHLLPALPDAWKKSGSAGLKTIGGFEILELSWQDGRITRLRIRSHLGGNLRLMVHNKLTSINARVTAAAGENPNDFFRLDATPAPMISDAAPVNDTNVPPGIQYDITTAKDRTYTFKNSD